MVGNRDDIYLSGSVQFHAKIMERSLKKGFILPRTVSLQNFSRKFSESVPGEKEHKKKTKNRQENIVATN